MEESLTIPVIIVLVIRLFFPLTILRWRIAGGIISIIADTLDVFIFDWFGFPSGGELIESVYHPLDKFLDIYYLTIECVIVYKFWKNPYARKTGLFLFGFRMVGFILFEITGIRQIFFFFPNVFEFFYLEWEIIKKYIPSFSLNSWKTLFLILAIVAIPNIIKEYFMHFIEFDTWPFFKRTLFWWMF